VSSSITLAILSYRDLKYHSIHVPDIVGGVAHSAQVLVSIDAVLVSINHSSRIPSSCFSSVDGLIFTSDTFFICVVLKSAIIYYLLTTSYPIGSVASYHY
jgi:hypothetical protein